MTTLSDLKRHVDAIYQFNADHQMVGINQFDGGDVPRFHLARCSSGYVCVFRHDVPAETRAAIQTLVDKEPNLSAPDAKPLFEDKYLELLEKDHPVEAVWHGPAYRFTTLQDAALDVTHINVANKECLNRYMPDWLPDVPHRSPFVALLVEGHAVAICASVRITAEAHEAGVETHPDFRKRGYAAAVVSAWAKAVKEKDALPLYSTSWDNHASQSVAKSLALEFIGTDFSVR